MLRESHGWDQSTLARRAGVSSSYISRLEAGKHPQPGAEKLRLVADALGVTLDELRGTPSGTPSLVTFAGVVGVPVVRWTAHAGSSSVWQEAGPREWLPADMERGRRLLAAEVIGRCLSPEIEPGDVVIFDQNRREPQDGEIAVITTPSSGVFVKKVLRIGDVMRLYPDDGDVPADEEVTIEGTALRVVKKLAR